MPHNQPIGINFQREGITALQLKTDRHGISIRAAAHLPLEKPLGETLEDLGNLRPLIRELVRQHAFKGKKAVVSLPHDDLHAFPVTIETTPQLPLETALAQACSKHLSFPLDQAVLDYFCIEKMPDAGHKLRVTVVAAHRERIEKVVEIFKQSGLRIQVIDYGLCALIRLHNHIHPLTDAPSVLVHMDESSTLLAVATRSEIVAHRQLDWGIGRLARRIAEALQLDDKTQQPRSMLLDYGVDYDALQDGHGTPRKKKNPPAPDEIAALRVVSQILVPSMEELVRELFQIIGYARSLSPQIQFRELWLYGRANEIKNLGPFLEKRLRIPTYTMAPFEKISLASMTAVDADDLNAYVGALGLSLREAQ